MLILDTDVVAELMRPAPDLAVSRWVDARFPGALAMTALTVAEILAAIGRVADARDRVALSTRFGGFVRTGFADRILMFDRVAEAALAEVVRRRVRLGRPIARLDAATAAIARAHRASVVTRNVRPFIDCGVPVIDPWAM